MLTFFLAWQSPNPAIPEVVKDSQPHVSIHVPCSVHASIGGLHVCVHPNPSASAAFELMPPSCSVVHWCALCLHSPQVWGMCILWSTAYIPAANTILCVSFYKLRLQHWDYSNNLLKQRFCLYFSVKYWTAPLMLNPPQRWVWESVYFIQF